MRQSPQCAYCRKMMWALKFKEAILMCHPFWHYGLFLPSYSCRNKCTFLAQNQFRNTRSKSLLHDQCKSDQLRREQRKLKEHVRISYDASWCAIEDLAGKFSLSSTPQCPFSCSESLQDHQCNSGELWQGERMDRHSRFLKFFWKSNLMG